MNKIVGLLYAVPYKTLIGIGLAGGSTAAWSMNLLDEKQYAAALTAAGVIGGIGIEHKTEKLKAAIEKGALALAAVLLGGALLAAGPAYAQDAPDEPMTNPSVGIEDDSLRLWILSLGRTTSITVLPYLDFGIDVFRDGAWIDLSPTRINPFGLGCVTPGIKKLPLGCPAD